MYHCGNVRWKWSYSNFQLFEIFCDGLGMVRVQEIISIRSNPISENEIEASVREGLKYISNPQKISPNLSMEMSFQHWKNLFQNRMKRCQNIGIGRIVGYFHVIV